MNDGRAAETAVSEYLEERGFKILARNWRNRWCEIDIVAQQGATIHFVEVKYRRNAAQGSGFDYITPRKSRQLKFAAAAWVSEQQWDGDYCIDVASITGPGSKIVWLENAVTQ